MIGLTSSVASLLVGMATGAVGLPFGVPPAPENPALARALPEQCLGCVSWAGTTSPAVNSRNRTEQLLAEPEIQNFLTQVGAAIRAGVKKQFPEEGPETRAAAAELADALLTIPLHQGAIFVSPAAKPKGGAKPKLPAENGLGAVAAPLSPQIAEAFSALGMADSDIGMVVLLGDDAARVKAAARKWAQQSRRLKATKNKPAAASGVKHDNRSPKQAEEPAPTRQMHHIQEITIDGQLWYRLTGVLDRPITFGFHGDYLVAATDDKTIQDIVRRMQNGPPAWWAKIRGQLPVERRSVAAYVNLRLVESVLSSGVPGRKAEIDAELDMLGLSNATTLIEVWGLEGEDFANKTLLVLDGKPRGLLRLVSDHPLRPEDLSAIPREAAFAAAARIDAQQALEIVLSSVEHAQPGFRKKTNLAIHRFEHKAGIDLRHGALNLLGDTWCVYNSPSENGMIFTGLTAVVPLRDPPAMVSPYGRVMALAKQWASREKTDSPVPGKMDFSSPRLEQFSFGGSDVYCLNCGVFAPAWCMTKSRMVASLSPQNVKAYLARGDRRESIDQLPRVAELFAGDNRPALVAYADSPRVFELLYPWVMMYGPAVTTAVRAEYDLKVDLSLMPSPVAVSRHVGPSVAVLRRTAAGIEFVSRGTIPLPSVPAHVVWWAIESLGSQSMFLIFPVYSGDPTRRQQELLFSEPPLTGEPVAPQPGPRRNDGPARPANDRPTAQVHFGGPDGMTINWDVKAPGAFDSEPLVCPANYNFPPGVTYRLKLSNIPGRPGLEFYPTLEVASTVPRTEAYLAHYSIPLVFTPEDFDQVTNGNFVAKVLYLPDPAFQESALAGVETLVSTRLEPGVDPIAEANRRGAILAIMRLGNKDLQAARRLQSGQHAMVAPSPTPAALPRVVQAPK